MSDLTEAIAALEQQHDALRKLCSEIVGTIEANCARGTITTANDEDFARMRKRWKAELHAFQLPPPVTHDIFSQPKPVTYAHHWDIHIDANGRRDAMAAVNRCWQAWSEGSEPCSGNGDGFRFNVDKDKKQ